VIRCGGMTTLFDGVDAATTLGILLREFTFGHTKQLASAAWAHLVSASHHGSVPPWRHGP
jgi:hypothetical protein